MHVTHFSFKVRVTSLKYHIFVCITRYKFLFYWKIEAIVLEVDSLHLVILLHPPKSAIAPSQLKKIGQFHPTLHASLNNNIS